MEELLSWGRFYRPNAFVNTPDILHEYLQHGGPPAFEVRLVLAATLSPSYGMYSGFESYENVPLRAGSEEYLDSEKYEVKRRALDGPLLPLVQRLNEVRRAEPALQRLENLRWLETENDNLVAYVKDDIVCVVNIDPRGEQEGVRRRARVAARVRGDRSACRRQLHLARRPQLREARPRRKPCAEGARVTLQSRHLAPSTAGPVLERDVAVLSPCSEQGACP